MGLVSCDSSDVLAFDRKSGCTRIVRGYQCEVIDGHGRLVQDLRSVDTDTGEAEFVVQVGRCLTIQKRRLTLPVQIVVKANVAEMKARNE